jgi:hypothetical protein
VKNLAPTIERLQSFLLESSWSLGRETAALKFFVPPENLGIRGKYRIALPLDSSRSGSDELVLRAIDSLRDIYGVHFDELYELLTRASFESVPSILSAKFVDTSTASGSIPVHTIASFLEGIERGLHHEVMFKLGTDASTARLSAQAFTRECRFLQTSKGSFVVRVEVPPSVVRQPDLFGKDAMDSSQVCSSFFSVIQFVDDEVLKGSRAFESEALLDQAVSLFTPELLESISHAVIKAEVETIDFSMQIGASVRTSSTGLITEQNLDRLNAYVEFIRAHFYGEKDFEVRGSIVELRSRDPQGNRNFIRVLAEFQGDRTFVSATLDNEQYQRALDAHRNKRTVVIRANGIRLKTHIRVTELLAFEA